jgi:UPF0755 protein
MPSARLRRTLFVLIVIILLIGATIFGYFTGFSFVENQNMRLGNLAALMAYHDSSPITAETPTAVEVYIPRESDTGDIAKILRQSGLIGSEFAFLMLSKFNGYDGNYRSGTHYLLPEMSYDEMMLVLTYQPKPVTITFPEGLTYLQVKQRLLDAGMRFNGDILDEMMRRPGLFPEYSFISEIDMSDQREWALQGYLWPDTYQFDVNMTEEQIVRTFLRNTEAKLEQNGYIERARAQEMRLDQVITLASIVQTEGPDEEMARIGRVFLNRIREGMPLQSCATINYLRLELGEEPVLWVKNDDLVRFANNAYNTYRDGSGLPPGPINSPGMSAIEGVLWPATERTWANAGYYYYFVARGDGTNDFSQTYEEHEEKAQYYAAQSE